MNRIYFFIFFFTLSVCSFSKEAKENSSRFPVSSERMLCTTITQAQQVRFNRCRNGEVMTGIQSLEPLTVYCTTLMANCRSQKSSVADPIELPWQEEISNTSSGYTEQEAAEKVHYYLKRKVRPGKASATLQKENFVLNTAKLNAKNITLNSGTAQAQSQSIVHKNPRSSHFKSTLLD